ncbi:hypothetical protein MTO96_010780 [Rhipicephalus appendiculatus]
MLFSYNANSYKCTSPQVCPCCIINITRKQQSITQAASEELALFSLIHKKQLRAHLPGQLTQGTNFRSRRIFCSSRRSIRRFITFCFPLLHKVLLVFVEHFSLSRCFTFLLNVKGSHSRRSSSLLFRSYSLLHQKHCLSHGFLLFLLILFQCLCEKQRLSNSFTLLCFSFHLLSQQFSFRCCQNVKLQPRLLFRQTWRTCREEVPPRSPSTDIRTSPNTTALRFRASIVL